MKDRISALMDGELDDRAAGEAIDALRRDAEAGQAWRTYHLISDAMRDTRLLSAGFAERVSARLDAEPTVLAPRRRAPEARRWLPVAAAASLAVALVGWVAFAPQQPAAPVLAPIAKQAQPAPQVAATPVPAMLPIPSSANDYLLAHQGFSPRVSLQGMAPYVRTVSEEAARR